MTSLSKSFTFSLLVFGSSLGALAESGALLACDAEGIPVACRVIARGATTGPEHCRNSVSKSRCHVDVEYSNGHRQRILGDTCVVWDSDCATGTKHALTPECSRYIDLD